MADLMVARSLLTEIQLRRTKEARQFDQELGLQAIAEYAPVSQGAVEHLLDVGKTPKDVLEQFCTAEQWTCRKSTGKTAREAFDRAEAEREKGRQQMKRDLAQGSISVLPLLVGTPRQVAWAASLREAHLQRSPDSEHRKQNKASWWIEHRDVL